LDEVRDEQDEIREYVEDLKEIDATLDPKKGSCARRKEKFESLADRFQGEGGPIRHHFAKTMLSFLAGLFVGGAKFAKIRDNLDLERWFRLPKSHERRVHGHRHAGVRMVQEGPTLVHALDAHASHPGPFRAEDLLPYRAARPPTSQTEAVNRRKIMRKARSKKSRPIRLAELERRYREAPAFYLFGGSLKKKWGLPP
jgi:hypothetical protein